MSNNANTVKIGSFQTSLSDYTSDGVINTIDLSNISITSGSTNSWNWTVAGAQGSSDIYTIAPSNISPVFASASASGTMELRGENADIKVNGRSLMDAIAKLEERLNVLVPNPELEAEWDQLRELGERYRELEQKCKEKGEMWKKLKSMPPPEVE